MKAETIAMINARPEANEQILERLSAFLKEHPEQRFGQALISSGILEFKQGKIWDPYFEESVVTLKRISKKCVQ